jgi:hypothetical protein
MLRVAVINQQGAFGLIWNGLKNILMILLLFLKMDVKLYHVSLLTSHDISVICWLFHFM